MKNTTTILKIISIFWVVLLTAGQASAQTAWVKAYNANCYYHTDPDAVFTWNGDVRNGYCNGYGTIQWYDDGQPSDKYTGYIENGKNEGYGVSYFSNGYKSYEGNWRNDMRNGYGTSYNSDGSVRFKGTFINDRIENQSLLETVADKLTGLVVDKIFDGGTNVRYRLVKIVYGTTGTLQEVRIKMMFNGNIVTDNYYRGTLVINLANPYIDFVDYNNNFMSYIQLKLTAAITDQIIDAFKSN